MDFKSLLNYIHYSWSLETTYKTMPTFRPKFSFSFYLFSKFPFLVWLLKLFLLEIKTEATELFQWICIFISWWKLHLVKKYFSDPKFQRVKRNNFKMLSNINCSTILWRPLKWPLLLFFPPWNPRELTIQCNLGLNLGSSYVLDIYVWAFSYWQAT